MQNDRFCDVALYPYPTSVDFACLFVTFPVAGGHGKIFFRVPKVPRDQQALSNIALTGVEGVRRRDGG